MKNFFIFLVCLLPSSLALASQELQALIRCHEALDGKADARTMKLDLSSPTPFLWNTGKKIYFVTADSIAVLENKFAGKDIVLRLDEKHQPFYRKISFLKDGSVGTVSFEDVKPVQKEKAETPHAQLDEASLSALTKELVRQMDSVTGEYQNKYDPQGTIESLNVCRAVKSPAMQKSLEKQIAFYEKLVKKKNPGAYSNSNSKKSGGTQ